MTAAAELRGEIRSGRWVAPTAGAAPGFAQANLVALPASHAADFEAFCNANPQPCPLLEVTEPGVWEPGIAPCADLRTDLPRYHVYRDGELAGETTDVRHLWREDTVAFLIGCSFTFEHALAAAGIPLRHIDQRRNVAMFRSALECTPVGPFGGAMVVTMRPLPRDRVDEATAICAALPEAHGAPVAAGDAAVLGIRDLGRPEFGDSVEVRDGEVPVYWACGVTAIEATRAAALPLVITHAPGHMFVTDRPIAPANG
jgi:uncharacterized protein YcsI (UPF0317 family)